MIVDNTFCQCHMLDRLDGEDFRERDDFELREGLFKLCLELILGRSLHGSGIRPHHWIRSCTSV